MKVKAAQSCLTLCDPHLLYSPWNFPGQNTGVGSLSLLQGIFLTQGSNPDLPHCRQILYQLNHKGSRGIHQKKEPLSPSLWGVRSLPLKRTTSKHRGLNHVDIPPRQHPPKFYINSSQHLKILLPVVSESLVQFLSLLSTVLTSIEIVLNNSSTRKVCCNFL